TSHARFPCQHPARLCAQRCGGLCRRHRLFDLGGLFVSFMSGNSTRMGVSLADGQWSHALEALGLIVLFVAGAAVGSLIVLGRSAHRQAVLLLVEALLLAAAGLAHHLGHQTLAVAAIVLAMGLENAVFQIDGG